MARRTKRRSTNAKKEEEVAQEKIETAIEEEEIIDEKDEVKEKEVVKLNSVESFAYECMKGIFVGGFMIGDLLGFYKKKDCDD